ncbi:unnamed protein product [Closterium sp. NIES-54]
MHNGASRANRLRASASVRTAVFYGAMLDSRSAAALAHRRPAVLAGRHSTELARLLYDHAVLAVDQANCRVARCLIHQAWHFILSTYQVRDDLYITHLEEKMTHIRMGEQESATDYCNRARRILAKMWMAGAGYSTASYISHVVKGLPRGYNLMKRMMMVLGTRESLDEDSITSYILQDEAMQEAKQPTELLPQANYAAPTKLNRQQGQRGKPGRGGSGGGQSTKDVDEKRSTRDKGRGGGGRWRECWILHDPNHLSYECPDRDDSDEDDTKGGRGRSTSRRPQRDAKPRKEKQTSKKTLSTKDVDNSSGGEASCSMVGVAEPTVSLAPEAGEDFQAVAAAVQANPMAVLLDSGCSHHLMGTKAVFVDMAPSDGVKHVRGFNGALQPVKGCGTVSLQGEAGKRVLIPDVLYVPGIQGNLLSAGQLKESGVQLQGNGDEMLLVAATREVVALRTIVSATKLTPDWLHARLAHVGVDTIKSSAKHEVATGLNIKPSTGADPPCVSCVGGKLARHTFPDKGSNAEEVLAVVHIDLCGPFWVAAKDGSLNFLMLKDRHTRFFEDLVSHLRTSDARYHATVPPEFLDRNQPPVFITLYFIVTRLPDSLRSVRDHFLSLDPTSLTVDLLEQHVLVVETSEVVVGAARGTPRPPFFEGCSPSPLVPSYASVAVVDVSVAEDVWAASASAKRCSSKGKGGKGGGGGSGSTGGGSSGGGGGGGTGGGSGGSGGGGGGSSGSGGSGGGGTGARRVGFGGGQRQQPQRRIETPSPEQLREWFLRGACGGSCPYVIRTGVRAGQTCGKLHTQHHCFSHLDDAWRAEFGDDVELPRWADLLRSRIAIFDLDFDAILSAMYALSVSAEGDSYRCVPPDPDIDVAALGASESGTLPGTTPAQALHTFTLDSGASRCFFRDSTSLTPLPAPFPVRLADPSGGPVVARSSTVLPCPAVPSGSLPCLHLPSFSTNLVSTTALQDAMVTTTTPGGQRVSICTCTRMGRHLATFTHRPGSSLYTLATEPPQVAASAQVSVSGKVAASCSCHLLSQQTLLWHHRLGHPSLPRLRGMHSRLLVSGLPRSLPPLPPSPALPYLPCIEGRQCAAPHYSFPPTTALLWTLHMDVWGLAPISGQGRERYFLLVVDDYTRYTTVFPLRSKGEVVDVLIPWIRSVRFQLREGFGQDLPVLRLHSNKRGEFSSDLLRDFCRGEGILQSFTLPDSPLQNGIAERRIGLVMEVACTSMIHAAAPHFLWPFATSPTLRWTAEVGDALVFRVWGSHAFGRDTSADKLSACAIPCAFLGFVPDAPCWQFYHTTSRRVLPTQDVTFDESVPFYRLFPYRSAPPPPPPLFLAPGHPAVDPLPPQDAAPGAASGGAASRGAEPGGAGSEGAGSGGAEPGGEEPRGAETEGVEPGGAKSEGAESGGAEPRGAALSRGPAGASPRLSPQHLREWLVRRARLRSGASGAGDAGAGGAGVTAAARGLGGTAAAGPGCARTRGAGATKTGGVGGAGAGDPTEPGAAGAGGSCAGGSGAGGAGAGGAGVRGTGAGGAGAAGAGAVDPGGGGTRGTVRPRPYFVPLLQQVLESRGLTLRLVLSRTIRTTRRVPCLRPPPVPGTHAMALRPSSVPLRVPLPAPPEASLREVPDPESDRARAASPTVSCLLATAVTDPSFDSAIASALVAEHLNFAAACRLDYAIALVAEQEDFECLAATIPRFSSMLLAPEGDQDAPDIPTPRSYTEAITGPYSSQWHAAMDAEMASWKSTGTYVEEVPPPGANIVDGMWIFRTFSPTPKMTTLRVLLHVAAQRDYELHSLDLNTAFLQGNLHEEIWLRRPPGFTESFPACTQWSLRQPFYGLRQAPPEWHDTLRTTLAALGFAPATSDPSLFLSTDTLLPPFYVLVYVDDLVFATADTKALTLVNSELQKSHTCTDLGELRSYLGLQITRDRARRTITLTQSHMVNHVLQRFGFYGPYPELVGCLMYLMTCTRPDLAYLLSLLARYVAPGRHQKVHWDAAKRVLHYLCSTSGMGLVLGGRGPVVLTGHADASWVDDSATQRSSQGYTFSLCSGSVSWRSTRSSSVLSSSCEAEIYAGAMAAQELRWLTYLLTDLGEQPCSPPVLYVDNKAMIALCQEHRLEHRMKHIALGYFLARELQQRGQLCLAYVATRANTADIFTKALPRGDH